MSRVPIPGPLEDNTAYSKLRKPSQLELYPRRR